MENIRESKRSGYSKSLLLVTFLFLSILIGFFTLNKYQNLFIEKEVNITAIEDEAFEGNELKSDIQSDIKDILQIEDDVIVVLEVDENIAAPIVQPSVNSLEFAIQIEKLNERIESLELRLQEFNQVVVNIPNYQQIVIAIIDLENAIKTGKEFAGIVLGIKNITEDSYITSRVDRISEANFLVIYGNDNINNNFTRSLSRYDNSLLLNNNSRNIWYKLLGDFIVIKKTGNFSGDAEDLIDQAEIFLYEGHIERALDNLRLLDEERYDFFQDFVRNATNSMEALRLCAEIKSYLNL
ncbi:MAG: hypothetical protein HOM96_01710 [Rickettsiales bacterium]|jgi:hypothetical protein|nr:hypothetical protein [Rickettsiales bacterium]